MGLMAIKRSVVAVPARLQSSRLPNKVLADIGGKPMIQRVLERCSEASRVAAVVLCTDSPHLQSLAKGWGFPVLMTAESCSSGSERIASGAGSSSVSGTRRAGPTPTPGSKRASPGTLCQGVSGVPPRPSDSPTKGHKLCMCIG